MSEFARPNGKPISLYNKYLPYKNLQNVNLLSFCQWDVVNQALSP